MKQKLPYVGAGLGTVLCGAAAAACVYSLVTIRARPKKLLTESGSPQVPVGLLRLSHPGDDFLHLLRNDVLLEKTIDRVSSRLLIYVETPLDMATSARLQFLSDLYNTVWDLACYVGKYELDIRLVASHDRSWDELLATPEVAGVFGYFGMDVSELNAQRKAHLPRVVFYPLKTYVERLVDPAQFVYLEDPSTALAKEAVVVVGGTFDHLHNGHKKLLSLAAAVTSSLLIVGLGYLIQPLDMRKRKVAEYLACIQPSLQADVMTIDDPFGPAISSPQITGIVVSTETVPGAVKINEIRAERGLSPLQIYVCRRTECSTLSSSFIREQIARR
ncbi:hypothetical protein SPRG_03841 [Saprolegnia parasitica CBS 223.65]|uniref:Cytidyltransferase-like domain-containing protein n=1 Tax=Saprolegnia parasitica (strain CBS 223.65) TaxID=695850 RepID=A0A067CL56_SAPPC|nr:hypothetical protein SPRG_03841 [Saprolegnia parasitica CBS 223.65]KDO31223.1 hypothetical protein SPRG_03841 [Saprolegnia parasitica CBS 223.65]|eukprot:XP_012197828.1 hypothetical protein SPRG_03841 [Saprolegnia parasitica CBS 223.65]